MNRAADIVQIIAFFGMFIGMGAVTILPRLLAARVWRLTFWPTQEAEFDPELERKLAIAEAAIAARKRGETFVPPSDYGR